MLERLTDGDVRALARAISLAEDQGAAAIELLRSAFPHTGRASIIGLTGPPGAGKSSLVDRLVTANRAAGRKVGVIAVDPSSTYSGGAILGDRVRMQEHAGDEGVFIRSMATRGHLGGLSRSTNDAIDLMDAAGYDPVLVETVGVGQDEIDIVRTADVVAVVLVPGMGDDIQAIKAGILEIADLFVINKADRVGADRLQSELDYMLSLVGPGDRPKPPILRTVAVRGDGVAELQQQLEARTAQSADPSNVTRRRERARARFLDLLRDRLIRSAVEGMADGELERIVASIAAHETDPYSAVDRALHGEEDA
ncbi:MAG: methylmalonyl Co-A mutase-associated GTPase MeaB [bacterium]|nr:methylmalonyl Co-A mutase-associated GTPase MeaB [bacterium]